MTEVAPRSVTELVVPFTYSSRLEDTVVPSRLSLMAFDAACVVYQHRGAQKIVVAGEQSYRAYPETTGDVLKASVSCDIDPAEIIVLRDDSNLLRNTAYQVDALVEHITPDQKVTVVCFGFHKKRIEQGFASHDDSSPNLEFVLVETVIEAVFQNMIFREDNFAADALFRDRYQLDVGWDVVKSRALASYKTREFFTRLAMLAGNDGRLLKFITSYRNRGRYDDIDRDGKAIKDTTI